MYFYYDIQAYKQLYEQEWQEMRQEVMEYVREMLDPFVTDGQRYLEEYENRKKAYQFN
jgi:hypothetical protein